MAGILKGTKIKSKHQTYVPGSVVFLAYLKKCDYVKKVMLGEINKVRPGKRNLKIRRTDGNLVVVVFRDTAATQVFNIVATDVDKCKSYIESF